MYIFHKSRSVKRRRVVLPVLVPLLLWLFPSFVFANPFLSDNASSVPRAVTATGGPQILVTAQLSVRDRIAAALSSFKAEQSPASIAIVLLGAFVYGIFHAAGPGHRKTILFSLFLAKKSKPWEPLAAGFLSAGLHALSALVVIGILSLLNGAVAGIAKIDITSTFIEGISFVVVASLALFLGIWKIGRLFEKKNRGGVAGAGDVVPRGNQNRYGIVIVSSIVPCPGATMLLILALYLKLILLGILAVVTMSLGMGLVISAAAYLAYFGRESFFSRLKAHERSIEVISNILELGSYLFMAAFSLYSAWPFLTSIEALSKLREF